MNIRESRVVNFSRPGERNKRSVQGDQEEIWGLISRLTAAQSPAANQMGALRFVAEEQLQSISGVHRH
jgi:hypothetical protein